MTEYREKIKEAEANALKIVDQLKKLQDEGFAYKNATEVVNKTHQQLNVMVQSIQSLAVEQQNYIKKLNEIDVTTILTRIDDGSNKLKKLKNFILIGFGATLLINLTMFIFLLAN